MTRLGDSPSGLPENPAPAAVEMVVVERRTLKKLLSVVAGCVDEISMVNYCEIMLYSLNSYLVEEEQPDYNKTILLLRYWLDVNPERLKETEGDLKEVYTTLKTVLDSKNNHFSC